MALTEDQKKNILVSINAGQFDAAAQTLSGKSGESDINEAISNFLQKFINLGGEQVNNKLGMLYDLIQQNSNQPVNIFENTLYNGFPEVDKKASDVNISDNADTASDAEISKMNIDDVEKKLQQVKSEQAFRIKTNQSLDPEKSKLIKKLQARKQQIEVLQTNIQQKDSAKDGGKSWYNFASAKEIGDTLDFQVCEGTVILEAVKRRLDNEIEEGHVVLSPQIATREKQTKDYINMYFKDMYEVLDANQFVKEVAKNFTTHRSIRGKLVERNGEIDQGGIYHIDGGYLLIVRNRSLDQVIPNYAIYLTGISDNVYFTIKFNHRYSGGNIYPDAFTFMEFKGTSCIGYIKSRKGVDVLGPQLEYLLTTQVRASKRSFADVTFENPENTRNITPKFSADDYIKQVNQQIINAMKKQTNITSHAIVESAPPVPPPVDTAPTKIQPANNVIPKTEIVAPAIKPTMQATNEPDDENIDSLDSEAASMQSSPESLKIDEKIANLQKLLDQAKFSKQTSTITRLENDIQQLVEQKNQLTQQPQTTSQNVSQSLDENIIKEEIKRNLDNSVLSKTLQQEIFTAITQNYDFTKLTAQQAKDILFKLYGSYTYDDLLKIRNKVLAAKAVNILPHLDDFFSIYVELSYIAGDYNRRANEIMASATKRSNDLAMEEKKATDAFQQLENKELSANDLKRKVDLQNKLRELKDQKMQIALDIRHAKMYLDADIAEIEKHDPTAEHVVYRNNKQDATQGEPSVLLNQYKEKLAKVSKKLPAISKAKFELKSDEDDIDYDNLDIGEISAEDLAELAVAVGKPISLDDEGKATVVLGLLKKAKDFDKATKLSFKSIGKFSTTINKIKDEIDQTQKAIIKLEKELSELKIANKVKLAPIIEEKRLIEEKLAHLEGQVNE